MPRRGRNVVTICGTLALGAIVLVGALALVGTVRDVQARVRFSRDPNASLIVIAAEPWVLQLGTIRLNVKGSGWTSVHGISLASHPNDWSNLGAAQAALVLAPTIHRHFVGRHVADVR